MILRWSQAAPLWADLVSFIDSENQQLRPVLNMLSSDHHWQALGYWVDRQKQVSSCSQKEAEDIIDAMLRLESWLEDGLSPLVLGSVLRQLPNLERIRTYVPVMVRAACCAAGFQTADEPDAHLANWRRECERSFGEDPQWPAGSNIKGRVKVPAAVVWTPEMQRAPEIAWLELETTLSGGDTLPHPGNVWSTIETAATPSQPEMSFSGAMRLAFQGARELAGLTGPCRGRWRIVNGAGIPLPQIYGESAGGAALLGWYRALTGTVVDHRVLVMAAVRAPETQGGQWCWAQVGGVEEKVNAALQSSIGIDTIAATGDCYSRVTAALRGQDKVRVFKLKTEIALH